MERFLIEPDVEVIEEAADQDPELDNFESAVKRSRLAVPVVAASKYIYLKS